MLYSFIGSEKNAGKTTALNFVFERLLQQSDKPVVLTSIGINGEKTDRFRGSDKPLVKLFPGGYAITAADHLQNKVGLFDLVHSFSRPQFVKDYLLVKVKNSFECVIEGPDTGESVLAVKSWMQGHLGDSSVLVDGSIDRKFLADPKISDGFFLSLLLGEKKEQIKSVRTLINCLKLPAVNDESRDWIHALSSQQLKSAVFDLEGRILFQGEKPAFLDEDLLRHLVESDGHRVFYLKGALTDKVLATLAGKEKIKVVLDNFTLFQASAFDTVMSRAMDGTLTLLNEPNIKAIFVREKGCDEFLDMPEGVPVVNLFREDMDAIAIEDWFS
jgi:hypothetical protein